MMPYETLRRYIFVAIGVVLVLFLWRISPPGDFPEGTFVTIQEGAGLQSLSLRLEEESVVRSPFWFRTAAIILGGERDMKAGEYYMERPENAFTLAWRVLHGNYNVETIKVTIPEGFTTDKISALFDERFDMFDRTTFQNLAPEGYLFPDTYFIPVNATASSTIKLLNDNFKRKIASVSDDVALSGRTLEDIIIMASILEAELKTKEEKQIASDILWKRLALGMPLQVDSELSTYQKTGLPERPINNPGLESIEAAIYPTSSPYLYFLTGDDGMTHYSRDFEEHVEKKRKYIKR